MKRIRFKDDEDDFIAVRPHSLTDDQNMYRTDRDDDGWSPPDYSSDGGSLKDVSEVNDNPARNYYFPVRRENEAYQEYQNDNDSDTQSMPDYGEDFDVSYTHDQRYHEGSVDEDSYLEPVVDYEEQARFESPRDYAETIAVRNPVPVRKPDRMDENDRRSKVEHPSYTLRRAIREAKQMGLLPIDEMGNPILAENDIGMSFQAASSVGNLTRSSPSKRECWARRCWSPRYHAHPRLQSHGEDEENEDRAQLQAKYGEVERTHSSSREKNKTWEQFKEVVTEWLSSLVIWRQHIKHIEGHFGTIIASYFTFLRCLLGMNVIMFLLIFIFISLPQILLSNDVFGKQNGTQTQCHDNYIESTPKDVNALALILDFLQGMGWMENTVLFVGYYDNVTVSFFGVKYNMPLAYICVVVVIFIYCLLRMLLTVRRGIKEGVIVSEKELQNYCNTVFAGWQFGIYKEATADLRKEILITELMGYLETEKQKKLQKERTRKEKVTLYFIRIVISMFIIAALGAGSFGIYKASEFSLKHQNRNETSDNKFEAFSIQYLPSIIITLMNLVMPIIFGGLIVFMKFSLITEINVKIRSTAILRLASIAVLLYSFSTQIKYLDPEKCGDCKKIPGADVCAPITCWENYVGRQIYKLVLLDFIIVMLMIFVFNLLRMLLVKKVQLKFIQWIGKSEFDISQHVLELIYTQILCWLGVFFSPLLPLVCIIKLVIFFYAKRFDLTFNCAASRQADRASKSNSSFMLILLLSFGFLVFLPLAYFLSEFSPSMGCSPFRSTHRVENIWYTVSATIEAWPYDLRVFVNTLTGAFVAIPLIIIIMIIIFYYYTIAAAYKKMSTTLKDYLVMEGRDKQFLLRRYQEVTTKIRQQTLPTDAKNAHVRRRLSPSSHQ